MLTLEILTNGAYVRIEVEAFGIVQNCHYVLCREEFTTSDPDKKYCRKSHYVRQSEYKRELGKPVLTTLLMKSR